ncbi:hypothetical protein CAPTEDRAFT_205544 [Capitella teleta]|uniref:CARD domain-containing protein n=1 Tax=Capitella teleta TaxID=283909 RepID=R7TXV1_CAPTE|nr:hypothetical protein CAPTEDRAFT_205544 [Capitella teleta]|eukprot:ELT98437.1 hypothetical protein CAPTEDRAFT_205544 [Capitella teleta]
MMNESHRNLLTRNMVALTTDLDPRNLYRLLIERSVLTLDDWERIRNISCRSEEAFELINVLLRKGSTAFGVFMDALQVPYPHLYGLLSGGRTDIIPQNAAEVRIQIDNGDEDVDRAELRLEIENEMLRASLVWYRNVRRVGDAIDFILARIENLGRRILGVRVGSVVFYVECPSVEALDDLWELCQSGKLARMFQNAFVTDSFLQRHKVKILDPICISIHLENTETKLHSSSLKEHPEVVQGKLVPRKQTPADVVPTYELDLATSTEQMRRSICEFETDNLCKQLLRNHQVCVEMSSLQ